MLLFVDESGHDDPRCLTRRWQGWLIPEQNLWNLVRAVRAVERDFFGGYLRDLRDEEPKARNY